MTRFFPFLLIALMALPASAFALDEREPEADYSPETLRFVFKDYTYVPPPQPYVGIRTSKGKISWAWVPLMFLLGSPMGVSDGNTLAPAVDPFALLGVTYPMTSKTWNERGLARRLRGETNAYPRADREMRKSERNDE
ncbi:MAG: hypothetical protein ACYC7A_18630 [Thermoanaerobaculia bacterium]